MSDATLVAFVAGFVLGVGATWKTAALYERTRDAYRQISRNWEGVRSYVGLAREQLHLLVATAAVTLLVVGAVGFLAWSRLS